LTAPATFSQTRPAVYRQNFLTTSTQHNTYVGIFAQDEWRLKRNLTISYGVRWEDENILRDLNNLGRASRSLTIPSNQARR